jgi:hypothetical protein
MYTPTGGSAFPHLAPSSVSENHGRGLGCHKLLGRAISTPAQAGGFTPVQAVVCTPDRAAGLTLGQAVACIRVRGVECTPDRVADSTWVQVAPPTPDPAVGSTPVPEGAFTLDPAVVFMPAQVAECTQARIPTRIEAAYRLGPR